MSRRHFEEEHDIFRESFRSFLQNEVVPHQDEWRKDGVVSRDVWLAAGENGYLLPWADESLGGAGLDDFRLNQRGNRLSIFPVDKKHWKIILGLE